MKTPEFSPHACKYFWYPPYYYAICPGDNGWHLIQYDSFWDHMHDWGAPGRVISDYFDDPDLLFRTVTIGGRPIKEIISEIPDGKEYRNPPFAYNYNRFIADTFHRVEYLFLFRGRSYFIDYWNANIRDPSWKPGWIFSADRGTTILVHENDFDEFIRKVDAWMIEHAGKSLQEMFDHDYKEDNSGDLQLEMIDWCHF